MRHSRQAGEEAKTMVGLQSATETERMLSEWEQLDYDAVSEVALHLRWTWNPQSQMA